MRVTNETAEMTKVNTDDAGEFFCSFKRGGVS